MFNARRFLLNARTPALAGLTGSCLVYSAYEASSLDSTSTTLSPPLQPQPTSSTHLPFSFLSSLISPLTNHSIALSAPKLPPYTPTPPDQSNQEEDKNYTPHLHRLSATSAGNSKEEFERAFKKIRDEKRVEMMKKGNVDSDEDLYPWLAKDDPDRPKPEAPYVSSSKEGSAVVNDSDGKDEKPTLTNWSATKTVQLEAILNPESLEDLALLVQTAHVRNLKIRPAGGALSPNGIGFADPYSINVCLGLLDKVLKVDRRNNTITVQSGTRVSQVIEALRPYNLTLPNLASIAEQQVGGFIQVGAHGTGATVTPVDDFVKSFKIVTPMFGVMHCSATENKELFEFGKVGLGCLGVVGEVTLNAIPAHKLLEHTYVLSRKDAIGKVGELLKRHKHVRYMWIPYEDAVVVVSNDPFDATKDEMEMPGQVIVSESDKIKPLTKLLLSHSDNKLTQIDAETLGFGALRDRLLELDPLSVSWVKKVNKAEHEFWKLSEGYRYLDSDKLLQFDCGGQQHVHEVCFPTGSMTNKTAEDMNFIVKLLSDIESKGGVIAAPSPIEQRWSKCSTSKMSPASIRDGAADSVYSWVGVIMYLPSDEVKQREAITESFTNDYCKLITNVGKPYKSVTHWAKIELPEDAGKMKEMQVLTRQRFPVVEFNELRRKYDPKNILGNRLVDGVLDYIPT